MAFKENFKEKWTQFKNKMRAYFSAFKEFISSDDTTKTDRPPINRTARTGLILLAIFFGLFSLWSLIAPLETAAIAEGKVIVATNRKTIEHLEGGIVKRIFVKEGDIVKTGSPLIQLDDTQARTNYTLWHNNENQLYATEARLIAERDHADKITFPEFLLKQSDNPEVQKIMKAQENIFKNNMQTLNGQLQILNQRILQLKEQIKSNQAQVEAGEQQLAFIAKELSAVEYLDKKHYVEKTRLWALKREQAKLMGARGDFLGAIAEAQQKIGETQQQILTLNDTTLKAVLKDLTETQTKLIDTAQKAEAAKDILKRTLISSPQNGIVMNLQEHTIGGVIDPGKPIMDIVPTQDKLIIEAQVKPSDIDVLHPGLKAKVQLVAYKKRNIPWLDGSVTEVSPDVFEDPNTHATYYNVRVAVPPSEFKNLKNVVLYPGMPVSVMIIIEERTPFQYFIMPIKDSFTKAFREQ